MNNFSLKADKTTNYYKTEPRLCDTCKQERLTKTYKKTNSKVPDMITLKDKKIAEKIELVKQIEVSTSRD